jgi:hypothetical protein
MLKPLIAAGSDLDAAAAAVPFLLDLTFDHNLVTEFVAELRQEAVRAAQLAMFEIGTAAKASCDLLGPIMNEDRQPKANMLVLGGNEVCVLKCLQSRAPVLLTIEDIMAATRIGRDTVCRVLKRLIEQGLGHRPNGSRMGATITLKGLKAADLINSGHPTQISR